MRVMAGVARADARSPLGRTSLRGGFVLQASLGGWDDVQDPFVAFDGHAKGPREGFENGLALMMRVGAPQIVDMHGHKRVIDESLKKLVHQIDIELADDGAR